MLILLTTPTYPPFNSGLGNAVAQQATCLVNSGNTVVVATSGERRHTRILDGVRVETFALTGADSFLNPIIGDKDGYLDFLASSKWDIIVLNAWQNWATDLALHHLAELHGRKFLYSHCISTNTFFKSQPIRSVIRYIAWRRYWWGIPKFMSHLDGLIFLSNSGVDSRFDDLAIARQLNATKINIVPNALSDTGLALLNKMPKRLEDRHKIIAVGSFHWQKGFDFVLRAYALSNACNKIPLHLYGYEHGVFCNSLRLLIKKLKIQEDFVFFNYGFSGRALAAEYEDAVLFLSGSHTECQPLVLLDAIAAGVPFIARATGCIDSMQGGVAISSESQMAYQLDYLLTDHVKWFELSAAGRTSAFENHHPEYISHKLNTILSSCSVN